MHELPQNLEAEQCTLGSLILNREAIIVVAPWLKPSHFYLLKHQWVYAAVLACYQTGTPPDVRTIADELRKHSDGRDATRLESIGGVAYLSGLVDTVPTSYHVEYYAREV